MIGLLAGVLNGAAFGRDVVDPSVPGNGATNTGQLVIALDVSRFIAPDVFAAEMDRHIKDLASSPTLPGFGSIRLPGADRRKRRADRSANGVQLPAPLLKQLDELAARLKLQPLGERTLN
jgi:LDH2 family malate/lactate/ureidoglycolate dehydrogenase